MSGSPLTNTPSLHRWRRQPGILSDPGHRAEIKGHEILPPRLRRGRIAKRPGVAPRFSPHRLSFDWLENRCLLSSGFDPAGVVRADSLRSPLLDQEAKHRIAIRRFSVDSSVLHDLNDPGATTGFGLFTRTEHYSAQVDNFRPMIVRTRIGFSAAFRHTTRGRKSSSSARRREFRIFSRYQATC